MPPFQIAPPPGKAAPAKVGKAPAPKAAPKAAPKPSGYGSALYNPSQQLSGQALATAAGNIANAQTAGPISELAKQMAVNQTQGQNAARDTAGYYMQLAKEAQSGVNQTTGIANDLSTQLQGINAGTQAQLAQFGAQAQGGALGRMGALGLDGGQLAQLQGSLAQQQGLGALNAQTFRSAGANQSANYRSAAAANLGTDALQGTTSIGDIQRASQLANEPLNAKIAALQEKKGALTGTALTQLRAAERNYQISQQGLGIKQQANQVTAANDAAKNALTASGQQIAKQNDLANQVLRAQQNATTSQNDAANQALKQAALNLKAAGSGNPIKPLTTKQNLAIDAEISQITGLIATAQKNGANEATIRAALATGQKGAPKGFDKTLIEAAYELLGYGSISQKTAGTMRSMGLRGNTYNGAPIKVSNYRATGRVIAGAGTPKTNSPLPQMPGNLL